MRGLDCLGMATLELVKRLGGIVVETTACPFHTGRWEGRKPFYRRCRLIILARGHNRYRNRPGRIERFVGRVLEKGRPRVSSEVTAWLDYQL